MSELNRPVVGAIIFSYQDDHTDLKMLAKIYDHTSVDTLRASIMAKKEEAD